MRYSSSVPTAPKRVRGAALGTGLLALLVLAGCHHCPVNPSEINVNPAGNGVDVVYDPVGGSLAESALRATAWQGRYLVIGFASGDIPKIPLNLVLLKGCQIMGVFWGSFAMRDPAKNREHAAKLFAWIAEGKLAPSIDAVLPFEEAAAALARLEQRQVKGKLVLRP